MKACARLLPEEVIQDFPRSSGASRHWGADWLLREGGKQRGRMLFLQQFQSWDQSSPTSLIPAAPHSQKAFLRLIFLERKHIIKS
ncbi:MAG: hypothetical protein D3909_10500 [Candidatus Electrothrix sp. ATG1]|nr:hypothetical protein [Candidatus Electrothrix sp. ATG1]